MSEQQMSKALAARIARVHEEMAKVEGSEATTLQHVRSCGEAIDKAVEEAGHPETGHGKLIGWYKASLSQYKVRTIQNYRSIHNGWEIVQAAKKGVKGEGDTKPRRTPRKKVSLDRIDLGTAIDAMALRICDLAAASPADRAALIGRLVIIQQKISEAVTGQMRPAA